MFFSVTIERDEKMMRNAWVAIDTNERIRGCGVLGIGRRFEPLQTGSAEPIIARLRVGVDAYDAITATYFLRSRT